MQNVPFEANYNYDSSPNELIPNNGVKEAANDNNDNNKKVEENGVSNCRYCDQTKTLNRKP